MVQRVGTLTKDKGFQPQGNRKQQKDDKPKRHSSICGFFFFPQKITLATVRRITGVGV